MYFIPFETARLRLRPQEAKDAGFALCIWGDPITGKYLTDPALEPSTISMSIWNFCGI